MKGIFKFKRFLRLYLANVISRFGDSVDAIAFAYLVFQLTGSKLLLASIFIVNVIPNILFSTFAGAVVDFYSKKKIIILGDLLRASIVLGAAFLYRAGLLETWHLYVMTFLNSTIESFVSPCKFATIPKLIDEDYYLQVNSTFQSIQGIVELLGLGIAGGLIVALGIEGVMFIDAATFLASGLIILTVAFPHEEKKQFTMDSYRASYKEGVTYVLKHKSILGLIVSAALINFFLSPFNALLPAYIDEVLKMGPEGISFISVALSIGGILGGILAGAIGKKVGPKGLIVSGLALLSVFYVVLGLPNYVPFFSSLLVIGVDAALLAAMASLAGAGLRTFLMTNIEKDKLARVGGVMSMFMMCASPLGAFLAGIFAVIMPLSMMIIIFGSMIMFAVLIPFFTLKENKGLSANEAA
ncbi:MFS transporter [Acidaminobacter sp. JC074]|uniref:MFS transporter n=1 Tax=Acidaminobacter sp. JC074 TaxID=2530199 RepID=UPI001F0D23DF|nr:MFS transporter [Acidaminobacter sp. JC074]